MCVVQMVNDILAGGRHIVIAEVEDEVGDKAHNQISDEAHDQVGDNHTINSATKLTIQLKMNCTIKSMTNGTNKSSFTFPFSLYVSFFTASINAFLSANTNACQLKWKLFSFPSLFKVQLIGRKHLKNN